MSTPENADKSEKAKTPEEAAKRAAKIKKLSSKTPEQLLAGVAARRAKADTPERLAKLDKKEAKIRARAPSSGA